MKNIFSCAMIVAMAFALVSCGGEKKSAEKADPGKPIKVLDKTIQGNLGEYAEFASDEATLFMKEEEVEFQGRNVLALIVRLEVPVKLIKVHPEYVGKNSVSQSGYFNIRLKDAEGKDLCGLTQTQENGGVLVNLLTSNSVGKTVTFKYEGVLVYEDEIQNVKEKAVACGLGEWDSYHIW